MKNSLNHLPENKQIELEKVAEVIRQNCSNVKIEVEKIILFGSYARGNFREAKDLKPNRKSGHVSDYDILVITNTKEEALNHSLWNQIKEEKLRPLKLSADPRIITHDITALNIKLAEGQYFFSDIKKEGIFLFDNGKKQLSRKRKLTKKEEQRIAQDHFDEWLGSAETFFEDFKFNLDKFSKSQRLVYLRKSAFHLHQTAESALKTLILTFENYCPNEHYLGFIQNDIEDFYPQIKDFFKKDSKENERRILLLEYAYIGGRYDPEYYISKEDLEILAIEVERLLKVTKDICEKKITNYAK
jgi:predicted nucleotidyltransferase/HEPN domain-containing protein